MPGLAAQVQPHRTAPARPPAALGRPLTRGPKGGLPHHQEAPQPGQPHKGPQAERELYVAPHGVPAGGRADGRAGLPNLVTSSWLVQVGPRHASFRLLSKRPRLLLKDIPYILSRGPASESTTHTPAGHVRDSRVLGPCEPTAGSRDHTARWKWAGGRWQSRRGLAPGPSRRSCSYRCCRWCQRPCN